MAENPFLLLGLHEERGEWFGTFLEVKEDGSHGAFFLHRFTPEEVIRIFTPLGGIRAVGDRFYEIYFGMEVTL